MAELTQASEREATARERMRLVGANIDQIRSEQGNPFFYGGRPSHDPKSEAHFAGYASHDAGLRLWLEWKQALNHVAEIKAELSS